MTDAGYFGCFSDARLRADASVVDYFSVVARTFTATTTRNSRPITVE